MELSWESPAISGYAARIARNNVWRFCGALDEADIYQELAITFLRVKEGWDPERGPQALMARFKTASRRKVIDLLRHHVGSRRADAFVQASLIEGLDAERSCGYRDYTEALGITGRDTAVAAETWIRIKESLRWATPPVVAYVRAILDGTFQRQLECGKTETRDAAIRRVCGVSEPTFRVHHFRPWLERLQAVA